MSNPIQRQYRKRMIEIWTESIKCNSSQRLADQVRLALKKICLSNLEILEICEHVNLEEYC